MPTQKIDPKVIFASDAPIIDKPPVFSDKTKGWDVARANDGRPTIKEMNKVQQDTDLKILWLNENSVTPYDESIDYPDGAVALKDGSFKQLIGGAWVEFLDDFANKDEVKRGIANRYDPSLTYNSGERVILTNGDIVKSTIDGNVNDPNVNMTGWFNITKDQRDFNATQLIFNSNFVTPEQFGCKANDPTFDNTVPLNNALATGFDVYSKSSNTYYVSAPLVGKGQKLRGGFKINSSAKVRPTFTNAIGLVAVDDNGLQDSENFKLLFVQRSHDLVEYFKIKSLGINTIVHYDLYNAGGTIQAVLDNAKTAGLRVIVGTENRSANVDTQVAFWSAYDSHPALFAYSMFDEPIARSITSTTQKTKVDKYRAMTKKPLTATEYYFTSLSALQLISDYDILILHNYARNWADADLNVKLQKDLALARKYYAYYYARFKDKRVIPVVGLFKSSTNDGFSDNENQIIEFAKIYGKSNVGDVGAFIWDVIGVNMPDNIGNNTTFQQVLKQLTFNAYSSKKSNVLLFGQGASTTYDFGMSDIVNTALEPNPIDPTVGKNEHAYPVRIHIDVSESLFGTTTANATYAGIGFKTQNAIYYSNIKIGRYGTVYASLADITAGFVGDVNFYLSNDRGVTKTLVASTTNTTIDVTFENTVGVDAILIIEVISTSPASANFRRFIRGVIMSSDW